MRNIASLHPRPSVHGEEPYPTRGVPVFVQNTADVKEYTLKNNPQSYGECRAYGMNGSG